MLSWFRSELEHLSAKALLVVHKENNFNFKIFELKFFKVKIFKLKLAEALRAPATRSRRTALLPAPSKI